MKQSVPDYIEWFRFQEPPFRMSPDPDFFFPSKAHKQVLDILKFGIARGEGFMVVSGHAGSGKTMLLRLVLNDLPRDKQAAVIVTPSVGPKGLMALLLEEMGIKPASERMDLAFLLKDFQEHVIKLAKADKGLLIVVDEAQDLPLETLEQLRLLSNIETGKKKLVQILLVGQLEIKNLLADPRLCQLTQRIVINEVLAPLDSQETIDYVRFRISKAGRADLHISQEFFRALYRRTKGLPRLINRAMDRTLLIAAASGAKTLQSKHLADALSTLPEPGTLVHAHTLKNLVARVSPGKNIVYGGLGCIAGIILCLAFFGTGSMPQARISNFFSTQNNIHESRIELNKPQGIPARLSVKSARIHAKPSKNSGVLGITKEGSRLIVLKEEGRWYKIRTDGKNKGSVTGWLLKKQVERGISAANTFSQKEDLGSRHNRRRPI
ncbi:MAG: hypothetical protein DSZ23_05770 [Thermodesulfatator sp.]|nr:MAG: hypothetical protein DSZ23_05770 [Thermodesulfatator sp.]